jgi:exopolyphosphatase / guanosine-5'-triphosphate,3'-diphosphate pyrophosphatase
MKRVAIIDLGSNTARLVLLGYEPERRYQLLDELREVVRLSEGMDRGGMNETRVIREAAFGRGLSALRSFRSYCDAAGLTEIRATATSAVRDAENGPEFLARAEAETGFRLEVLSGEAEAACGVLAVANSSAFRDALVMDVGGGSAQLSVMRGRRFAAGLSRPLGALRVTERLLGSAPGKKDLRALRREVKRAFGGFLEGARGLPLIGMGGSLRNLAAVAMKRAKHPTDLLHGYALSEAALGRILRDLSEKDVAARRAVPGLSADRADIIVAGAAVILEVMRLHGAAHILVSGQGIREGLFYPYLFPEGEHLAEDVRGFSVGNLERRYYDHPAHNAQVARLALTLFDGLAPLHGLGSQERDWLAHAGRLHDIGMAVGYYDHHQHGFYLVMSAALPGFTQREQAILALLVRYHRKGTPGEQGLGRLLEPGDTDRVLKLAALLRLAEYLDRSKAQRVRDLRCALEPGRVQIVASAQGDAAAELRSAAGRRDLLERALGVAVDLRLAPHPAPDHN